jgi:hypothetical protein
MSAGHYHRYPNPLNPKNGLAQLNRKLTTCDAPELMKRWNALSFDYDIVYGTGYNVQGTTRYVDRDLMRSLYDAAYAEKVLGAPIDTGLSPDDTLECLLRHEMVEKVILDSQQPPDVYNSLPSAQIDGDTFPVLPGAHDYATAAEHELVFAKGGKPYRYERGLAKIFEYCATKIA